MKIVIKGTQEEFDEKRVDLIKALAGSKYDVTITPKGEGSMEDEKTPFYVAQAKILEEWDREWFAMIREIKSEIEAVLEEM